MTRTKDFNILVAGGLTGLAELLSLLEDQDEEIVTIDFDPSDESTHPVHAHFCLVNLQSNYVDGMNAYLAFTKKYESCTVPVIAFANHDLDQSLVAQSLDAGIIEVVRVPADLYELKQKICNLVGLCRNKKKIQDEKNRLEILNKELNWKIDEQRQDLDANQWKLKEAVNAKVKALNTLNTMRTEETLIDHISDLFKYNIKAFGELLESRVEDVGKKGVNKGLPQMKSRVLTVAGIYESVFSDRQEGQSSDLKSTIELAVNSISFLHGLQEQSIELKTDLEIEKASPDSAFYSGVILTEMLLAMLKDLPKDDQGKITITVSTDHSGQIFLKTTSANCRPDESDRTIFQKYTNDIVNHLGGQTSVCEGEEVCICVTLPNSIPASLSKRKA